MCVRFFSCRLLVWPLVLFLLYSCKKADTPPGNSSNNNTNNNAQLPPTVTSIGTPVGSPISKIIGTAGGTLVSDGGDLELNIPAGALDSNTNISIQAVTNEAPGGFGLSYDLLPNGTKFKKPATIIYHYADHDLMGNAPIFLAIAYQDSSKHWVTDLEHQFLDSTAKTLSLDVNHFTIFSSFDLGVTMEASPRTLKASEISQIRVSEVLEQNSRLTSLDQLPDDVVTNWRVDISEGGNSVVGTISGTGSRVDYHAPSEIPDRRTVRISAHIKVNMTIYYRGQRIDLPNGFESSTDITLEPDEREYNYHISLNILDSTISGFADGNGHGLVVYLDDAKFDLLVHIKNGMIQSTVSNIINKPPTCEPANKDYHGTTFVWLADPFGEANITDVKLGGSSLSSDSTLTFNIIHSNANYYGYILKNTSDGSVSVSTPPIAFGGSGGIPPSFQIDLKRREGYLSATGAFGSYVYVAVVPQ